MNKSCKKLKLKTTKNRIRQRQTTLKLMMKIQTLNRLKLNKMISQKLKNKIN